VPRKQRTDTDEQSYLAAYDASRYPRPSVAVDVVLLTVADDQLHVLLARRPEQPQLGKWALPGTFLGMDESIDATAARALRTKTGLEDIFIEQLYTFGEPGRDPRTRVISVAYYALVEPARLQEAVARHADAGLRLARVSDDALPVDDHDTPLPMAFDHASIVAQAIERIRGKLSYAPIGFELLGGTFTLRDLRRVHQAILGRELNKDSFRRTILDRGLVTATGEVLTGVGHRPPALYRFSGGDRGVS